MKIIKLVLLILVLQSCNNESASSTQNSIAELGGNELIDADLDSMFNNFNPHVMGINSVEVANRNERDSVLFYINTHFVNDHVVIVVNNIKYLDDNVTTYYSIGLASAVYVSNEDLLQDSIVKFSVNSHDYYISHKRNFDSNYHFNYHDRKVKLTYGRLNEIFD